MQRARRANPYPFTWEIPAAVAVTFLLVLSGVVHVARTVANVIAGAGWAWTPRTELFTAMPGLLAGDANAGLSVAHGDPASATLLWVVMSIGCILAVLVAGVGLRRALGRWGPHRMRGMASPREAERLLGVSRLRKHAPVMRPDLYRPRRGQRT